MLFGGVDDPNAMFETLLADGVLIRDVGIPGHLRVSAGTTDETTAFLEAAGRFRAQTDAASAAPIGL